MYAYWKIEMGSKSLPKLALFTHNENIRCNNILMKEENAAPMFADMM